MARTKKAEVIVEQEIIAEQEVSSMDNKQENVIEQEVVVMEQDNKQEQEGVKMQEVMEQGSPKKDINVMISELVKQERAKLDEEHKLYLGYFDINYFNNSLVSLDEIEQEVKQELLVDNISTYRLCELVGIYLKRNTKRGASAQLSKNAGITKSAVSMYNTIYKWLCANDLEKFFEEYAYEVVFNRDRAYALREQDITEEQALEIFACNESGVLKMNSDEFNKKYLGKSEQEQNKDGEQEQEVAEEQEVKQEQEVAEEGSLVVVAGVSFNLDGEELTELLDYMLAKFGNKAILPNA